MTTLAAMALGLGLAGAATQEALVLQPGVPVTRELAANETHRYAVDLKAGDLLEAVVEQLGADVAIDVAGPDADPVRDIDYRNEPTRSERVLWIASATGTQSVGIRAAVDRPAARYRIVLAAPRPATAGDTRRVMAQRGFERAVSVWRGFAKKEFHEARVEALGRLESALSEFRAAGDRRGEADVLEDLANLHGSYNRHAPALSHAEKALPIVRALEDPAAELALLGRIGWAKYSLGDTAAGLQHLEYVLRRARETGNEWREGICLNDIGTIHRRSGQVEKAVEMHDLAVTRSRACGNRRIEAFSLNNLGIAYKELGDYQRALSSHGEALARFQAMREAMHEARALNNMGIDYQLMGDDVRARDTFLEVLEASRRQDPGGDTEAAALNNLGSTLRRLGDYGPALEHSRQALEIRTRRRDPSGQAFALHNIGQSLAGLGQSDQALAGLREALRIRRAIGERHREAETLLAIAEVERSRGNLNQALPPAEESIALTEALRGAITNPDLRTTFVASQQDAYAVYIDILMRLHGADPSAGHDAAALQASERARARVLLESLIEARADIRAGVDAVLLESERAAQQQLREASERLSRATTEGGSEGAVAQARADFGARSEELKQVQSRIRQSSPRYAALTQPRPATLDEIRRHVLDEETVLIEVYLGQEHGFLWGVSRTGMVSQPLESATRIQAAARRVHELLTERQRQVAASAISEADSQLAMESEQLSGLVLGAIADMLRGQWKGKRLLVVASGALAYVPFGVLPSPGDRTRPLAMDHEIVYAPSASLLAGLRLERGGSSAAATGIAVLADPVFEASDPRVRREAVAAGYPVAIGLRRAAASLGRGGFARLPFSRKEADGIAALITPARLMKAMDFRATRALVAEGQLGDRRIVHFATHGLLDSQHPDLSGLVLSLVDENGAPQDGFVRMPEIYNLRLNADLVVLSGCQTALGKEIRGEGLVGLTRGFMYAGARAVVASLWQVDDESTAELMKRFYRGMLKENRRPADALRQAQLEMSRHKRWSAPFYWAGFVLQGEWR